MRFLGTNSFKRINRPTDILVLREERRQSNCRRVKLLSMLASKAPIFSASIKRHLDPLVVVVMEALVLGPDQDLVLVASEVLALAEPVLEALA